MKPTDIAGIFASIVVLATITTLVLPGRQTARILQTGLTGFSGNINAAMGGQLPKYVYS